MDTNIIFSCLLNSNSNIGYLLFNSSQQFEFYSCSYMRYEIQNHWDKLKRISKLSNDRLQTSYFQILSNLTFINEEIIPEEIWIAAEQLTLKIDVDDTDFVAMANFLDAGLWTGDKQLYDGLKKTLFRKVYNTEEMAKLRSGKSV